MALAVILAMAVGFMLGRSRPVKPEKKERHAPVVKKAERRPVAQKKVAALPAITKKVSNPRIAIVLDDFGYNTADMEDFFDIGEPITLSVLPNLPYSSKTAEMAHSRGYEVILHLPLEPKGSGVQEEPSTIRSSMTDQEILAILKKELDGIPYIKGVSNHMGSKCTEDVRVMSVIMAELKKRGLFFFDSLTSEKSVCREAARKAGVLYARRDIFLDIPNDPPYIDKKMMEMRKMAFSRGTAIAVGHYRRNTIAALKRFLPLMADEGVRFVYISELER